MEPYTGMLVCGFSQGAFITFSLYNSVLLSSLFIKEKKRRNRRNNCTLKENWKFCLLPSGWVSRTSAHPKQHWQRCRFLLEWNSVLLSVKKIFPGYWSRCFYGNWYNFILVMDNRGKLQGGLRWWSFILQSLADPFSGVIRQFGLCFIFTGHCLGRLCTASWEKW